jgi:hypothetical protein
MGLPPAPTDPLSERLSARLDDALTAASLALELAADLPSRSRHAASLLSAARRELGAAQRALDVLRRPRRGGAPGRADLAPIVARAAAPYGDLLRMRRRLPDERRLVALPRALVADLAEELLAGFVHLLDPLSSLSLGLDTSRGGCRHALVLSGRSGLPVAALRILLGLEASARPPRPGGSDPAAWRVAAALARAAERGALCRARVTACGVVGVRLGLPAA